MTARNAPAVATDRGAASTQLVLAAPVVLLLILLAVQVAVAWHAQHIAQTAAAQGLAAARAHDGTQADGVSAARRALRNTAGRVLNSPRVTVDRTATATTVRVRGSVLPVLPGLDLNVSGHAAGPSERFVTVRGGS